MVREKSKIIGRIGVEASQATAQRRLDPSVWLVVIHRGAGLKCSGCGSSESRFGHGGFESPDWLEGVFCSSGCYLGGEADLPVESYEELCSRLDRFLVENDRHWLTKEVKNAS